jgi:Phage integrase family
MPSRWGEAAALQWADIDFEGREIYVRRSLCDETREVKAVKDKDDRWVPLSPHVAELLKAHRETMDLEADLRRWTPEQPQWVFLRENSELPRYPSFLEHFWQKLLKRAGDDLRRPPLLIPDVKAGVVETNCSAIIRANQAHRIGCCDREGASIAGVSGAATSSLLPRATDSPAACPS